ncbi:MAG: CapA family protein [Phycisphaerae bacterium]
MKNKNAEIILAFAGDFCPSEEGVCKRMRQVTRPADILGPAAIPLGASDLSIVNLEYPLTYRKEASVKYGSHQRGDPESVRILKDSGVDVVTLANNHMLDYCEGGLQDTIDACRSSGIACVGAGSDLVEASSILNCEVRGVPVSVIAFCENEFSVTTGNSPGTFGLDVVRCSQKIKEAKGNSDIVIVQVHAGSEFTHYPSPNTVRLFRFLVDCGATVVVGHHPHYIQGYELYKGSAILYSLGKLIYTRMDDSGLLEVPVATVSYDVMTSELSVEYDFFRADKQNHQLVSLSNDEKAELDVRFSEYCTAIASEEVISKHWDKYCLEERNEMYLATLLGVTMFKYRVLRRLGMLSYLKKLAIKKRANLMKLENYIRCESHREALLTILENLRRQD